MANCTIIPIKSEQELGEVLDGMTEVQIASAVGLLIAFRAHSNCPAAYDAVLGEVARYATR